MPVGAERRGQCGKEVNRLTVSIMLFESNFKSIACYLSQGLSNCNFDMQD